MSDIASTFRRHWIEIAWSAFAAANVAVIFALGQWETIPFHFVWVSLALVYAWRLWSLRSTLVTLAVVCVVTGVALAWGISHAEHGPGLDELTEVPLMAAVFLAMVWHASRAKRAISAQDRLLDRQREFVRDASHELRTPITVATGHAELVRAAADGQIAEDSEVVLDELGRLSRLSEQMLMLAAAEHPDFLHPSRISAGPMINRLVRRWSPTAHRRWRVGMVDDGWVEADPERLEIALDALIENAVKFTTDDDEIAVSATREGDSLVIEVADSGSGIPPEQLSVIFDRFARVDPGRSRGSGGTGLGLAITKAVVDAHGGVVSAASVPGEGSSFRISLGGFHPDGERARARAGSTEEA